MPTSQLQGLRSHPDMPVATTRGTSNTTSHPSTVDTSHTFSESPENTTKTTAISGTTITTPTAHTTGIPTIANIQQSADKTSPEISCTTFNCKGYTQSVDAISQLMISSDVLGLCETWLRPGELPLTYFSTIFCLI